MVTYEYPRPALTVDLVTFRVNNDQLELLLIQRDNQPFQGAWALPGGFVHENEPLEATASRVLSAKAELTDVFLEQLATFGAPERDPRDRVVSVAYFALLPAGAGYNGPGEWFAVDGLPQTAFDHAHIIDTAIDRLRAKLSYSDIGFSLMPPEFTLTELQKTWEAVLASSLDKRNFRKGALARDRLEATGKKTSGGAHPPAMIYRYNDSSEMTS
ncbi:MAG: NUDIX domain-containing protein [Pseudomonadota bacterium]